MEDYIELLKKYRVLIVIYVLIFVLILYFIWRPKTEEETSFFTITDASETEMHDRFYSYYKKTLDQVFLEGNYENIYNNYLLEDYKTKNYITLQNVESVIKQKCESFSSATITKYSIDNTGETVIYHVDFMNQNSENSLEIYEFSPYDFKIAFGKKVYNMELEAEEGTYVSDDDVVQTDTEEEEEKNNNISVTKEGLQFDIVKEEQYDNFLKYSIKVTNVETTAVNVNLIQNNNLVLVDSENRYYAGSVSDNDSKRLEKGNYITFTASFKVNLDNQSSLKSMKFLKVEKNGEINEIEISI